MSTLPLVTATLVLGHLGGNDKFNNLRILHKDVHRLIHQTDKKAIDTLITKLGITIPMVQRLTNIVKNAEWN